MKEVLMLEVPLQLKAGGRERGSEWKDETVFSGTANTWLCEEHGTADEKIREKTEEVGRGTGPFRPGQLNNSV